MSIQNKKLAGKVAVVTGASKGTQLAVLLLFIALTIAAASRFRNELVHKSPILEPTAAAR